MNFQETEQKFTSGFYNKKPLTIVRGEGCRVWDDKGNEYLDMIAGIAVVSCGHAHPPVPGYKRWRR